MGAIGSKFGKAVEAKLSVELGGSNFYVPESECGENWAVLRRTLGTETARKLVAEFGGKIVYIPIMTDKRELASAIRRRLESGETIVQIARTTRISVRLSERAIRSLIRRY